MTLDAGLGGAAHRLGIAYRVLRASRWYKPAPQTGRKTPPHFGPQSPTPDGDAAFNLEEQLLSDRPSATLPTGLAVIADQALQAVGVLGGGACRGVELAAMLEENAERIESRFPYVEELIHLCGEQEHYIGQWINRRSHVPDPPALSADKSTGEGFGTASELAPLVSVFVGREVTRKHISYLGVSKQVTTYQTPRGTTCYRFDDVVRCLQKEE
ncbi:hypothetical protein HMPREF1219_00151 [Corynebacterium pyruviciproducens ATCC BAA-1742]|uniref:Uncharacterized protein n=1 Tax=Corynebacterium pyruviciproducens ATCC BAA-1742 TaxID=1125779 RepID=S2Z372_9CORY|nr:hypothetical protein [Corynebacterium pyruviciproducens]EPD70856.1 hypothetical protein HMPREF1219_00151 [Corynebacterium pyruviciproducens ATCC BAA-1742]